MSKKKRNIDALKVDSEFKQTGGSCVLASYALAANYFTGISMTCFFDGYCEHFGLVPEDGKTSENLYSSHFDSEWRKRRVRGYEVVLDLHKRSHVWCFVEARQVMNGTFFFHSDVRFLEKKLMRKSAFLNVAYNAGHEFHSISVFSDGKYLFGRDTNRKNCFLINKGLGSIGVLRDSVLYEARKT
jgi:hypothetical protein